MLGVICVVLYLSCWPTTQPGGSSSVNSSSSASKLPLGSESEAVLKTFEGVVNVTSTREAHDEYMKYALAKDEVGFKQMILNGKLAVLECGTVVGIKCKVIDRAFGLRQVRLREGPLKDELVWVNADYVFPTGR